MRHIRRLTAAACCLTGAIAAGCSAQPITPPDRAALIGTRPVLPGRFYGVTVDDLTKLDQIVTSLEHLPRKPAKPAVRIVLDPNMPPAGYRRAIQAIGKVAYLMAEPVDSSEVTSYTTREYVNRFRRYVAAFSSQVALWEVGNEVNGDWLGPANRVTADIAGAYDVVRAARARTALTLSYEPHCAADAAHDMWTWAAKNIPRDMKLGLDYVLVSYYEEDCDGYRPAAKEWDTVFRRLHHMFPHAKLGFGEVGTYQKDRISYKIAYLNRYYRLRIDVPGYIGGYFWWYYAEDMLPYQRGPLWRALVADMR